MELNSSATPSTSKSFENRSIPDLSTTVEHHEHQHIQHNQNCQTNHQNDANSSNNESLNKDNSNLIDSKWKRFSEWIHCICIVTFDLELGQAMELVYPNHIKLSEQEKTNICYLAFPDSNSGCMGDTQFHIRLRVNPLSPESLLNLSHRSFNAQCIPVQKADPGHFWGFVYFRQMKDTTLPRGYFQKSFIILTRLPFFNLYYEICTLIAPRYFKDGLPLLHNVCEQICHWPQLKAGETINLQLLGNNYQTVIPKSSNNRAYENCNALICKNGIREESSSSSGTSLSMSSSSKTINNEKSGTENEDDNIKSRLVIGPMLPPQVLSSLHDIDIFRSLSNVITHIHMIWELVLIAEPIVVMGTSPADCSHMVQSLVSLISPLAYCGESRPYFTIHDSEFKEFTQRTQGPPPIIIGVTNPFFTKPLQNWPHLIRLQENQLQLNQMQPVLITSGNDTLFNNDLTMNNSNSNNFLCGNNIGISNVNYSSGTSSNLRKVKAFNSKFLENTPGVYTKYKPYLQKDKTIIKKILHGIKTKRPLSVQSALLRRHLLELTQSFMIPLERYIASLMPLQKDISPFKAAPIPNQFKPDDFLSSLEHSGPHLTSTLKGDWEGLYKRFFRSPNFKGWYESRDLELRQTLQALQLQALSEADINKWIQGKHEVEIVDMILKLKNKLKLCNDPTHQQNHKGAATTTPTTGNYSNTVNCILRASTRNQLLKHLESMKQSLPDDLKTILNDT